VADNGDAGVVVLDSSNVTIQGGRITGHKGPALNARDHAVVEVRNVDLGGNSGGEFRLDGEAKLVRTQP
jgi:hypothetical protein